MTVYLYCLSYQTCKSHISYTTSYCHVWLEWLYHFFFSILSHERHFFFGKKLLNIKCILWFSLQTLSKTFPIQDEFSELLSQLYTSLHTRYPLFLQDLNEPWNFQSDFRKILKYKISWQSVQWKPSCSMRTDSRFEQFYEDVCRAKFQHQSTVSVRL